MIDGEILIAGLGSIGERHVRNLLKLGHKKIAVLRRGATPPRTLKGDEFTTVTDVHAAFERRPAALIVATPSSMHRELLEHAVEARVPVIVEVPLSHSLDGLEAIANKAEKSNVPVLIAHNLRFHPALAAIREALRAGRIGDPLYSRSQFGEYLPDCHPWADYRQRYEARADMGGGAMLTSIHELDHVYWLFGRIEAVTCVARRTALDVDVEDVAMMILEHEKGVLSEIELDFVQRTYRRSLQVCGREGTLEWELLGEAVRYFDPQKKAWGELMNFKGYDINKTYIDELEHFARVIRGEEAPLVSLRDGMHVLDAGLAALRASSTGVRQKVSAIAMGAK